MVVPAGMLRVPVPEIVPPLQLMDAAVRLIGAVPFSVPPLMVSVGNVSVGPLLRVSVPPLTLSGPMPVMLFSVVVPPLEYVVPLMFQVAFTVFVPEPHCTLPAPEIVVAASKVLL